MNCREPISEEILPESKKQALAAAEREYEEMRDRIRAQKGGNSKEGGTFDLGAIGDSDMGSFD
ncbi:hypothetical protein [Chamaesiphon minutus]|nr:hypothetical protein [Chamaesiphon minutus]